MPVNNVPNIIEKALRRWELFQVEKSVEGFEHLLSHVQVHLLTKLLAHQPTSEELLLLSYWDLFSR